MKTWRLDNQQRVSVDQQCNVHFQHYFVKGKSDISLTWRQFLNLNDVVMDLATFENMKYYPLGKNLWLQYDECSIQLYYCNRRRYFTFHQQSWSRYIKVTHRLILTFLRHEAVHRRQRAAPDATLFQSESGGTSSPNSQQQILPRATSHAGGENEQRKKRTTLSKRDSTNSGRAFSFRGAVDALRTTTDPASDMEEGEDCVIQLDREQFSDFV